MPPIRTRTMKRSSLRTKTSKEPSKRRTTYTSKFGGAPSRKSSSKTKTSSTRSRTKKRSTISSKYGISSKAKAFSTYKSYKKVQRDASIKESAKLKANFSLNSSNPHAKIKRPVKYEDVIKELFNSK